MASMMTRGRGQKRKQESPATSARGTAPPARKLPDIPQLSAFRVFQHEMLVRSAPCIYGTSVQAVPLITKRAEREEEALRKRLDCSDSESDQLDGPVEVLEDAGRWVTKSGSPAPYLTVRLVCSTDGTTIWYRMRPTTAFEKLMDAYCLKALSPYHPADPRFFSSKQDVLLRPQDTPKSVGMEDGDTIQVLLW